MQSSLSPQSKTPAWRILWPRWAVAHLLPLATVWLPVLALRGVAPRGALSLFAYVSLLTSIACAQWLALRRFVGWANIWAAATLGGLVLGWGAGLPPMAAFSPTRYEIPGVLLAHTIGGTILGTAQWLVLRRHVPQAGWWIATNALAWPLLAGAALIVWQQTWIPGYLVGAFAGSAEMTTLLRLTAVYGLVTGPALAWLLSSPVREEQMSAAFNRETGIAES